MRRLVTTIAICFITFVLGVASMELYLAYCPRFKITELRTNTACSADLLYETLDGKRIRVAHEACIPSRGEDLLQWYKSEAKVIEQGPRVNWLGREIGGRVAVEWPWWEGGEKDGVRIILTSERGSFWLIDSPSMELAGEFERSFEFRYAMSNDAMQPTANTAALMRETWP